MRSQQGCNAFALNIPALHPALTDSQTFRKPLRSNPHSVIFKHRRPENRRQTPPEQTSGTISQTLASSTILNGPSVARRTLENPPERITSDNFASPAWAPSPSATSWSREVGTQIMVDAL